MAYYNIVGEITEDCLQDLISYFDSLVPDENKVRIYINSEGGCYQTMRAMIDLIEHHSNVTLIAYGMIASSAFELFFLTNCSKKLLPSTRGLMHLPYFVTSVNSIGKTNKGFIQQNKMHMRELVKRVEILSESISLPVKQRNLLIKKGEDVFFEYEEMLILLSENAKYFKNKKV